MKKILVLFSFAFLIGTSLSVAAKPPERGGGVTKVQKFNNEVNHTDQYEMPVVQATEQLANFYESFDSVSLRHDLNYDYEIATAGKTEKIKTDNRLYLLNCSIRQCFSRTASAVTDMNI